MNSIPNRSGGVAPRGPFPLPSRVLFPIVGAGIVALFLIFPAPFNEKAHAALHGLCAQRPSHTFLFGDHRLPFDARMTGIYGGFLISAVYLVARKRHRVFGLPPLAVIGALAAGVGTLAIDGTNSLLLDLGLWHPYQPQNEIRLATGLLTGVALAVTLCFLVATTIWSSGRARERVVGSLGEFALIVALQLPFAALVLAGPSWLYRPVALGLILSAATVVSLLALVVLTILRRRENSYVHLEALGAPATLAVVVGIVGMAAISGSRFLLEHLTGVQTLP